MTDLRKALDNLEKVCPYFPGDQELLDESIKALRTALAQSEQEHLEQYPAGMMTKVNSLSISDGDKPRALRFAEMLMNPVPTTTDAAIALELRRLHKENEALRQALDKPEIAPKVLVDMAVLAEREACAQVLENHVSYDFCRCACECAEAIRARGIDGATVGEVGIWGEK
jgi:hypothetical protein